LPTSRYEKMVNASRDFITLIDRDYRYNFVNESYAHELGMPAEAIVGKTLAEVWGEEKFKKKIKDKLDRCFDGKEVHDIDQFKFGKEVKHVHISYYPYEEAAGTSYVMAFSHDVSVLKKLEFKLLDFEFKDPITGLFNRRSFNIVLDMELEKAKRALKDGVRAVLFINLKNISSINASFGLELGDLLLESTALRIKDALRATDYVFRFDGKEFAVILSTLKRGIDLPLVAENIRNKTNFPYSHKGTVINISCNIGAAIFPDDGDDRNQIISNAISAMNEARERDEPLVMFNKVLHERGLFKARLRADIRTAFIEKQFEAYFQPIVDMDGNIVGAEALTRWHHPELGSISPVDFIPVAEESGSIFMIGRWILFQVCRYIKQWEAFFGNRYVSINLSSKEFAGPTLVEDIQGIIKLEGISPRSLKLEITESQIMENWECIVAKILRLETIGVEVLIDDFGSGFSSLAYLKRLPAQTIKVDKAFVDRIVEDEEDRSFLKGVITMIESKRKKVLVEGVADPRQYAILRDLGVSYLQGYHFSTPLPAAEFRRLLQAGAALPESGAVSRK